MRSLLASAIIAASITPALADGVSDVMATVEMRISVTHCGLNPPDSVKYPIIQRAVDYTGMSDKDYSLAMIQAADAKAAEMIANGTMGRFCANMARIYERAE